MKRNLLRASVALITIAILGVTHTTFAAAPKNTSTHAPLTNQPSKFTKTNSPRRGAGGVVTAINGTTITLSSNGKNPVTYTIDASHAHALSMGRKLADVSNIKVGDTISALGIMTGSNILAQTIMIRPASTGTPKAFAKFHKTKTTH